MPNFAQPVSLNKTWLTPDGQMSATGQQLLNQLQYICQYLWASDTTANRPVNPVLGQIFWDTTLGELIQCINIGSPTTGTPATWAPITGGGGAVSITATTPIVVAPSPITGAGIISLANSGVVASTYGSASLVPVLTIDAQGIVTVATTAAIGPDTDNITATSPIVVTPSPITNTGVISLANSGVAAGTYGDSTHTAQVTVDAQGILTAASSVFIPGTAGSEWIASGLTPTQTSATTFTVTGNNTSTLAVGRRLESTNTGGTIYSTITASVFGGGVTTVTVINDSGVLDSGLSFVAFGILQALNRSIPVPTALRVYSTATTSLSTFGPSVIGSGGTPTTAYDVLGEWAAGTFTCKQAGVYTFSVYLSLNMSAVTWLVQPGIGFGVPVGAGGGYPHTGFTPTWYPTTGAVDLSQTAEFKLNQGDTLSSTTEAGFSAGTITYHYDLTITRAGT